MQKLVLGLLLVLFTNNAKALLVENYLQVEPSPGVSVESLQSLLALFELELVSSNPTQLHVLVPCGKGDVWVAILSRMNEVGYVEQKEVALTSLHATPPPDPNCHASKEDAYYDVWADKLTLPAVRLDDSQYYFQVDLVAPFTVLKFEKLAVDLEIVE